MVDYTIGICITKNEEATITGMLQTLDKDIKSKQLPGSLETIVCLNNHTEETSRLLSQQVAIFPGLNLSVVESEPGLINAQKKVLGLSQSGSDFVIFYDADIVVHPGSTLELINALNRNKSTHAVTGDQVAYPLNDFWYRVYNIEALHPELSFPERKYIIGKIFGIRKSSYFIPGFMLSDDTFLSHHLVHNYGESAIERVKDANVTYMGPKTFRDYFNKVRRFKRESEKMYEHFQEFIGLKGYFKRYIDQRRLRELPLNERFQMKLHDTIKKLCYALVEYSGEEIWVPLGTTKDRRIYERLEV